MNRRYKEVSRRTVRMQWPIKGLFSREQMGEIKALSETTGGTGRSGGVLLSSLFPVLPSFSPRSAYFFHNDDRGGVVIKNTANYMPEDSNIHITVVRTSNFI
jgi:hypothetical protein